MSKHKNDIYGDLEKDRENEGAKPAIPAATVLLLREHKNQNQVLMLHKTSKIAFGGMWVFPGGKIDAADYINGPDDNAAARVAAARETEEEAGISIPADEFIWFAHWTPPASTARRFATWFFLTRWWRNPEPSMDQSIRCTAAACQRGNRPGASYMGLAVSPFTIRHH
jgi:8-oxo-dGTP pyrophosphatase MutT (NUDIX family)